MKTKKIRRSPLTIAGLVVMAVAVSGMTGTSESATVYAFQTMRWTSQDSGDGYDWNALLGYTGVSTAGSHWRARGVVSYWSWQPGSALEDLDSSGLGAAYLMAGRTVWNWRRPRAFGQIWLQAKASLPLDSTPSIATTGEVDWGGSLLATNRIRDLIVFVEIGYLNPGDPPGLAYRSQGSLAVSASWDPGSFLLRPVASFVTAGQATDTGEGYREWSLGLGVRLDSRTSLSATRSWGTTAASPDRGWSLAFSRRL